MDAILIVLIVAVVAVAIAAGFYFYQRNQRSEQLRERFGPEYERTVSEAGKGSGERELKQREERVDKLEIRDLSNEERAKYSERWTKVQADFVDRPESAISDADSLVQEVMAARGYPIADFEQRAADLSVQHAGVIEHYRQGHAISESHRKSPRSTEDLRQAMIHYRALFSELLGKSAHVLELSRRRKEFEMTSEPIEPRSTADLAYGRNTAGDTDGQVDAPRRESTDASEQAPLLSSDKSRDYSGRWQEVQAEFVDEPQKAVRDADGLVAEVIQSLATTFADQRKELEDQWSKGSEVSTEDLRQALMQYRSFFQRLLAA